MRVARIESSRKEIPVVDVYSLSGKKVDRFKLNPDIFNANVNRSVLHQVITMYHANQRQGTVSTKTRGEVRGGGRKPWRQKGTGRARVGSIRSPLWRGGGVIFGPKPRDFGFSVPKKMKRLALISSLSAKVKDNGIMVLEKDPEFARPRTKEMAKILKALKIYNTRILFICGTKNDNLSKSAGNIRNLTVKLSRDFNAYDVLVNTRVLFSRHTYNNIVERLSDKRK